MAKSNLIRRGISAPPSRVAFKSRQNIPVGLEALDLTQLRQRGTTRHLAKVQRLEALLFVLYTAGESEHVADFESYPVKENTLIVLKVGTVHQFHLNDSLQGEILIVDRSFMLPDKLAWLRPLLAGAPWPICSQLSSRCANELKQILNEIKNDIGRSANKELISALLRQRLYTWLILLRMEWDTNPSQQYADPKAVHLVNEFEFLLEQHFLKHWTVRDYAEKLGYAERTLSRACADFGGQSAKLMIDRRLLTEAKRMLAYQENGVEDIGIHLGFEAASHFIRFFKRTNGTTPSEFRQRERAGRF